MKYKWKETNKIKKRAFIDLVRCGSWWKWSRGEASKEVIESLGWVILNIEYQNKIRIHFTMQRQKRTKPTTPNNPTTAQKNEKEDIREKRRTKSKR